MFANWYAKLNLFSLATFLPVSEETALNKQKNIFKRQLSVAVHISRKCIYFVQ